VTKSKLKAFSLIELSIVILVIGILIAGIMEGRDILYKAKLSAARALSQSSDVASIKNLVVWVDATQENSVINISDSKIVSDGDNIKSWTDRNPQFQVPLVFSTSTANTYPIYRDSAINGLPALQFNGSNGAGSGYYLSTPSESRIAKPDNFSIFAVFTPLSGYAPSDRIGILAKQTSSTVFNEMYGINFNGVNKTLNAVVMGGSPTVPTAINLFSPISNIITDNVASIAGVTHDTQNSTSGFKLYKNGTNFASRNPSTSIIDAGTALNIGSGRSTPETTRFCKCYISEIIMYDRALKKEEINSVTKYLGQKWGIAVAS
jgi:prepilin-type N-terminal cleavage/methylation domain-containing protein